MLLPSVGHLARRYSRSLDVTWLCFEFGTVDGAASGRVRGAATEVAAAPHAMDGGRHGPEQGWGGRHSQEGGVRCYGGSAQPF